MLSDAARRVLTLTCSDHTVATCVACQKDYLFTQLGFDFFGQQHFRCPSCGSDFDDQLHQHILSCSAISGLLDEGVERSMRIIKDSQGLTTQAAILAAESDELARRVLDVKRESSQVRGVRTVIEQIGALLFQQRPICADCVSRETSIPPDVVMQRVEGIRTSIRISVERGTCRDCRHQDVIVMRLG